MDRPEMMKFDELDEKNKARFFNARKLFNDKFGHQPTIICRVPGRVNLIGEHVDYCGYSVCPMALDQDIIITAAVPQGEGPFLTLVNSQSDVYPDIVVNDSQFKISIEKDGWAAYVLCGIKGLMLRMEPRKAPLRMEMAITGRVPPGSGLSSSSALVCASLLTASVLNDVVLCKHDMAELSASCERFIGMEGGGMDQAIAFLATKGCAKHIKFNPVRTKDVQLPDNAIFVICHSLVTKKKAETSEYNMRVVECRLAAQIITKKGGADWRQVRKISDVQKALGISLQSLIQAVTLYLHDGVYTKEEICKELDVSENELEEISMTPNTYDMKEFKLLPRISHVVNEAHRVEWWLKEKTIEGLGNLMTASHNSMAVLYEASHPSCDRLVAAAMNSGAAGARITGAGWGGCVVALTTRSQLPEFLSSVRSSYYSDYDGNIDDVLFPTEPQSGACIVIP